MRMYLSHSKEIFMNTLRKSFIIGLTVLGMGTASLAAQADDAPTGAAGMHDMHDMHAMHDEGAGKPAEHMGEYHAKHQAMLHSKLKLSAAQEPAWNAFVAATAPPPAPRMHPDHAAMAKMTAPERLEQWITFSKEHVTMQENHLVALKTFYATLTPAQKKIFDDNMMGGDHKMHRGHKMP